MKKIYVDQPNKLFFASDHHFGHANIIKHCTRPYPNVTAMDADLIARWNAVVPKDGQVVYLGDLTMNLKPELIREYVNQLNGKFIGFTPGNHDLLLERFYPVAGIPSISNDLLVEVRDGTFSRTIHCYHYPIMSWYKKFRGSWHLYGHIHNNEPGISDANAYNVGVDVNNFEPVSYVKLKTIIAERQ